VVKNSCNSCFLFCFILLLVSSCGNKNNLPNVSDIPVNVKVDRFDQAFFSVDTNNIKPALYKLTQQFPYFTNDFVVNVLGVAPLNDTSITSFTACREFISTYNSLKDSLEPKFQNLDWLEKELKHGFQFIKYYFPKYQLPQKVLTYIGPFDAPAVALTPSALAIGLQLYAGKNFSFYTSVQGQEIYPKYMSRRFEPPYITINCIKTIAEDIFPDNGDNKPLIEQMIEKGKYWYLLDKFLPETADSLKTGFSQKQLDWCNANEGLIWNFFLQTGNELYTIDPDIIKNYIGEAPNTPGMPDVSPGNIGQWVGWQIVKKYVEKNSGITPVELMKTSAKKIFEEAKYKPR
jgi:hypothetical protein